MSFKLIREAQARLHMDDEQYKLARHVSSVLKKNVLSEAFNPSEFEVTPQHYNQWLETLLDIAQERGVSANKRSDFNEIAFEILDNDSFIDALGGDTEMAKENIVKTLWQSYQVNKAHQRVSKHVSDTIERTREEEEMVDQLVGAEDEEAGGFAQAFKQAQGMEDEESMFKRSVGPRTVYQHAVHKSSRKNPYPPGSLRASIWDDMHPSVEDEQVDRFDDEMPEEEFDHHADVGGEEALEQRVDDLESRVADLESEGGDDVEMSSAEDAVEIPMDADDSDDVKMDDDVEVVDEPAPRMERPAPRMSESRPAPRKPEFDEEEQVKQLFHKAITAPKDHLTAALKGVEDEGVKAWMAMNMPRNPHPKDSPAHKAWAKGFKNAAKDGLGFADKPRETTSKQKSRKK